MMLHHAVKRLTVLLTPFLATPHGLCGEPGFQDCNGNSIDDSVDIAGGPVEFPTVDSFEVAREAFSMDLVDLDTDGVVDVVIPQFSDDSTAVFMGRGQGRFERTQTLRVGSSPVTAAHGDLNEDGFPDIAVSNLGSHDVSVLLGSSDGLIASEPFPVVRVPFDLWVADFNHDLHDDLLITMREGGLALLPGRGDGTFSEGILHAFDDTTFDSLVADLDRDGELDVAFANFTRNRVQVLRGLGDGSFAPRSAVRAGAETVSLAPIDLDEDGAQDLVACSQRSTDVHFLKNDGGGQFSVSARSVMGYEPSRVATGDVDDDGRTDVLVVSRRDGLIRTYMGGEGALAEGPFIFTPRFPTMAVVADLTGEGKNDLAVVTLSSQWWLFRGREADPFDGFGVSSFELEDGVTGVAIADLNEDGEVDMAAGHSGSSGISVLLGDGTGRFAKAGSFASGLSPSPTPELLSLDLNRDGHVDLAAARSGSLSILVLMGRGDGGFFPESSYEVGSSTHDIVAGDFNADSIVDLATVLYDTSELSLLLGQEDGTFLVERAGATGDKPLSLTAADFDQDGALDVVSTSETSSARIHWGTGNAALSAPQSLLVPDWTISIVHGDFDEDGAMDIAAAGLDLFIVIHESGRSFRDSVRMDVGRFQNDLAVGDLNADGHLDLVAADQSENDLIVSRGLGNGRFETEARFRRASFLRKAVLGELDGDGRVDCVVSESMGVTVLMNGTDIPVSRDCNASAVPDECELRDGTLEDRNENGIPDPCEPLELELFHRGDANGDGILDISDGLCLLGFLFDGEQGPTCLDAADANDDGALDCSDPVFVLGYLFLGSEKPAAPGPPPDECGIDPGSSLGCTSYSGCASPAG